MTCILAPGCDGPLQQHHLVPRQTIRRRYREFDAHRRRTGEDLRPFTLTAALADPRDRVDLCHMHHGRVEMRRIYIERDRLPEGVFGFADELGLGWYLDRFFPSRVYGEQK